MASVYGEVGSLETLLDKFEENGFSTINSLGDIQEFKDNYVNELAKTREKYRLEHVKNLEVLNHQLEELTTDYDHKINQREKQLLKEREETALWLKEYESKASNFIYKLTNYPKQNVLKSKLKTLSNNLDEEKKRPFVDINNQICTLKSEFEDKVDNFDDWVNKLSDPEISELEKLKRMIDANMDLVAGAYGEIRAQNVLKQLPDSFSVINNFYRKFHPPIYDKKNDDHICSIQIDHIVVGPTGIFLIETKNWSESSVNNKDLYSPIKQLLRSSHAIFVLLNSRASSSFGSTFNQQWGIQKISPKNILLMINNQPDREYQFVSMLYLNEVNNFIQNGKYIFSPVQVEELVDNFIQAMDD